MPSSRPTFDTQSRTLSSASIIVAEIADKHQRLHGGTSAEIRGLAERLAELSAECAGNVALDPLPKGQARVMDFIRRHIAKHECPPTRVEIAQALGFASANGAEEHLKALARKGVVELIPGMARGIKIRKL